MNGGMVTSEHYIIYLYDNGSGAPIQGDLVMFGEEEVGIQEIEEYKLTDTRLAYRVSLVR
jgi:hypothetical protein